MGKVKGEDVMLYIQDISNAKCADPIGCARSITFNMDVDMIETSITGNGSFRTYIPGAKTVTANIEGLVGILNSTTTVLTGTITRYYIFALPNPVQGFIIDTPDLCIPVGSTIIVNGDIFDDAPYTVVSYFNSGGGTAIVVSGTVPPFSPFVGTITIQVFDFSTERIYAALTSNLPLLFEFYETDNEGHYLQKTFSGYFNSITEVASFDNIVTFSADITASGLPTITYGNV